MNEAPNEEAKKTAVQLRAIMLAGLEAAIDNDWAEVRYRLDQAKVMVDHVDVIENGYDKRQDRFEFNPLP